MDSALALRSWLRKCPGYDADRSYVKSHWAGSTEEHFVDGVRIGIFIDRSDHWVTVNPGGLEDKYTPEFWDKALFGSTAGSDLAREALELPRTGRKLFAWECRWVQDHLQQLVEVLKDSAFNPEQFRNDL